MYNRTDTKKALELKPTRSVKPKRVKLIDQHDRTATYLFKIAVILLIVRAYIL